MPSPEKCPYKPGLHTYQDLGGRGWDAQTMEFIDAPIGRAIPVIVLGDVTEYDRYILALRFDIEIMFPDGQIAVIKSLPNNYKKLTPLNNAPTTE